ncbi:unnamed protein product [Amaranthus hypochondriacus]
MSFIKSRTWMVMAAVEGMKDHGYARWNHTIKSLQQHVKINNMRSYHHTNKLSASSSSIISKKMKDQQTKQCDESLRTVMYLSCWGPNS